MNPELVAPLVMYPNPRARAHNHGAVHRTAKSQIIHENHLKSKGKDIPAWTDTLQMLESRTPKRTTGWKKHALKVVVPAEAVKVLTTNLDNNIWDIHDRTTCEVELYKGIEGDGRSALLLSGDDVAVQEAANIIMGVCEDALIFRPDPSKPGAPLLRGDPEVAKELCITSKVTHQPRSLRILRKSPYIWNHRFEDIPKPRTWDQFSFLNYIRTLTLAKLRPHRAIEFYGTPQAADEVVMVLMNEAFRDRNAADALTVTAFKLALECMEEKGLSFRPHARRLLTQMQIRRLPIDTDVFNKFLLGSALVRDIENFNQMLDFMASYNCAPNYRTWRLVLQMVHDEGAKRDVVRAMDGIGLLHNPHAVSDVVREVVGFDMYRAVAAGKDVKTFCNEVDEAYGPTWPSVTALNRAINVCSHFGRFDMCYDLLDHFQNEYNKTPDMKTFVTLLAGMRATNSFPAALSILRRFERQTWLHSKTFHFYRDLFTVAWRWRLTNVMAVVWAYACLEEATCFSMRFRVAQHLASPGYMMAPNYRWRHQREMYRYFAMPGYVPRELGWALAEELRDQPDQAEHQGAVVARLFRDGFSGFAPTEPLSAAVERAWELDRRLLAQRQVVADRPGSHVVSIRAELGVEDVMEIPVRGGKEGKERVVRVPVTSEAVVHNYEEGWYVDVEKHPEVKYTPGRCAIKGAGETPFEWEEEEFAGPEIEGEPALVSDEAGLEREAGPSFEGLRKLEEAARDSEGKARR